MMVTPLGPGPGDMGPHHDAATVTPSDTTILAPTRALYVGGAGAVAVTMQSGMVLTFAAATAGSLLPVCVKRVMATGTTATNIVALY